MKHVYFGKFGLGSTANTYAFVLDSEIEKDKLRLNGTYVRFPLPERTVMYNLDTGSKYKSSLKPYHNQKTATLNIEFVLDKYKHEIECIVKDLKCNAQVHMWVDIDITCSGCDQEDGCEMPRSYALTSCCEFDVMKEFTVNTYPEKGVASVENIKYPRLFDSLKIKKINPKKEGFDVGKIRFEPFVKRTDGDV